MLSVGIMSYVTTSSPHFPFPYSCPCIVLYCILFYSILFQPSRSLSFSLPWPPPTLSSLLFSTLLPPLFPSPLLTFAFNSSLCCRLQSTTQQRVRLWVVPVLAHLSYMQSLVRPSGDPAPCGRSSEECCRQFLFPRHLEFLQISSSEEVSRSRYYYLITFLFIDEGWRKHLERFKKLV